MSAIVVAAVARSTPDGAMRAAAALKPGRACPVGAASPPCQLRGKGSLDMLRQGRPSLFLSPPARDTSEEEKEKRARRRPLATCERVCKANYYTTVLNNPSLTNEAEHTPTERVREREIGREVPQRHGFPPDAMT